MELSIESLDDLIKQNTILYTTINNTETSEYFQRMANIENRFYEIWKNITLNDSLTLTERAQYVVWDYPLTIKYSTIWKSMKTLGLLQNLDEVVKKVENSTSN